MSDHSRRSRPCWDASTGSPTVLRVHAGSFISTTLSAATYCNCVSESMRADRHSPYTFGDLSISRSSRRCVLRNAGAAALIKIVATPTRVARWPSQSDHLIGISSRAGRENFVAAFSTAMTKPYWGSQCMLRSWFVDVDSHWCQGSHR